VWQVATRLEGRDPGKLMKLQRHSRHLRRFAALTTLAALLCVPSMLSAAGNSKVQARSQFDNAEKMREALNGQPASERSKREYQRVMDAYRRVYYMAPASSKADSSVVAVAELLAEMGRAFNDEKALRSAIGQYEFLRREYPGSKSRFDALFTIGQIYKDDLQENDNAKEAFQEFVKKYSHHRLAEDARDAISEIDAQSAPKGRKEEKSKEVKEAKAAQEKKANMPLVTGIRYWSTPDYTRVAIDLEQEIKYEAGRVPDPDRIFFDLHDTKLASVLVGKSFDVSDGFLRKIRIAQFQKGLTRVVLDVDDVSDYSAFLLPNPYRLIIDIHGRQPQKMLQTKNSAKPEKTEPKTEAKAETKPTTTPAAPKTEEPKTTVASSTTPDGVKKIVDNAPVKPKEPVKTAKAEKSEPAEDAPEQSTKTEVAKLKGPATKTTNKPTSEPTFESVAPRSKKDKKVAKLEEPTIRSAKPTSTGERSLVRALGLKIGKIVVDAGHGGHDTGTIGPSGLLEKDLTLDVALRLGRLLENRLGAEVVYTRDDDTFIPLETRTAIANQNQADLFISIHANSSADTNARGIETYYLNFTSSTDALEVAARENAVSEKSIHELQDLVKKIALKDKIEESREFASDVQRSLYTGVSQKSPGIRDRGVKKAPFIVLIGANMPSVLAEISFLSNPGDERKLQTPDHRQKIAESLYRGIQKYVSGLSGMKLATKGKEEMGQ
jgi:N-acetylmuramoyl-L-alanine amidase